MKRSMRFVVGFFLAMAWWGLVGCPASSNSALKQKQQADEKKSQAMGLLPKSAKKKLKKRYYSPLPKNIQTVKVKKGIPLYLYLHPGGIISEKPFGAKNWVNQMIMKGRSRSWYVKLDPEPGVHLGRYTFIRLIMAVWNAPGHFSVTSRVSVQFLLRRGNKEKLLFSSMQLPKGQRYQAYDLSNREINYESEEESKLQPGDVLVFRVKHRSGNGGAVALGGGIGPRGSFFVIASHRISNYYQYTK